MFVQQRPEPVERRGIVEPAVQREQRRQGRITPGASGQAQVGPSEPGARPPRTSAMIWLGRRSDPFSMPLATETIGTPGGR